MRRLVVELYGRGFEKRVEGSSFQGIKSMEVIHVLKNDQNEFAAICRITLKDADSSVEDAFKNDGVTMAVQVLEREEEKRVGEEGPAFLVLLKRRPRPGFLFGDTMTKPGAGYLFSPLDFKDGKLRFTFVGTQKQVKEILGGAEERGIQYRVVSLTDADFAPDSLLNRLTDKQRKILIMAYKLGYFDVPKKINSDEVARRLHLTGSTVVEHLSKAERRLLVGIIGET